MLIVHVKDSVFSNWLREKKSLVNITQILKKTPKHRKRLHEISFTKEDIFGIFCIMDE